MATNEDEEFPPSPEHFSDENFSGEELGQEDEEDEKPLTQHKDSVSQLLSRLQNSGAIVKKPIPVPIPIPVKVEKNYHCYKCEIDFPDWESLEDHLIPHVSQPSIILDRLPSDDESEPDHEPGDEVWTDDDEPDVKNKVDVSQLLKYKNISMKKVESPAKPSDALSKLQGLGIIKTGNTPVKKEIESEDNKDDLMKKLGSLGGLKLKLQNTSHGNTSSFKIINGLKDFNTDDDPDDEENSDKEADQSGESEEMEKTPETPTKVIPQEQNKPNPRVKITNVLRIVPPKVQASDNTQNDKNNTADEMENVVVKNEPIDEQNNIPANENNISTNQNIPMDSQVKSECPTPPLETISATSSIKVESDYYPETASNVQITDVTDLPEPAPIEPKKEKNDPVAVIEINGDSGDDDDDCCVVSSTPAPDIKPKIENIAYPPVSMPYPSQQTSTNNILNSRLSTQSAYSEKQHNFNWNAPDQKPEILEKSADAIFESLLASSSHKKEPSLSEVSEYISLDNLHTCEVCQTRFTDTTMLENHKRTTGHSKSLVAPSSSALLPSYNPPSNILSSLFPVKQLADQVGRLSSVGGSGSSQPFTHQQNMIINIQAYPTGQSMHQQPYNPYSNQQQPMGASYPGGNMYRMPGQPTAGQTYPSAYPQGQYPSQSYPTAPGTYPSPQPPYSQASPLQGMQQQVYNQQMQGQMPGQMASGQMAPGPMGGQMGAQLPNQMPPSSMAGPMAPPQQFPPPCSPNSMKPPPAPGSIRIQNVQSYSPGQNSSPMQVRGAGPSPRGIRPRMPSIRPGMRPSVRPGVNVAGRGGKRMPMKRPGAGMQGPMPKKKMDMLLPGRHDNEDCTVMSMQKQRDGLPMIDSVQGSKDNYGLGSGISITKKTVNKEASGMASLLAARGIMVKQKAKSRSPSPERPIPHIPNLGAGVSIKHTSKNSQFSIPEAKVGGSMNSCKICKKMFMNSASLSVHMNTAHPGSKLPMYKCEECPAGYPKLAQLQHHKRVFHNVSGPDRELGLPVVDLSQEETLLKLSNLGVYSFIPLANREQASGCFGIPVISVHNMNNGMVRGLTALGADGLLSLGPLKPLPNT